ncbi:hypothetical protein [Nitrospira sp. KM1]|nr:hypothetical protein [Nitrospira sp. KM1]
MTGEGAVVGWTFRGKKVRRLQLGFAMDKLERGWRDDRLGFGEA